MLTPVVPVIRNESSRPISFARRCTLCYFAIPPVTPSVHLPPEAHWACLHTQGWRHRPGGCFTSIQSRAVLRYAAGTSDRESHPLRVRLPYLWVGLKIPRLTLEVSPSGSNRALMVSRGTSLTIHHAIIQLSFAIVIVFSTIYIPHVEAR